MSTQPIAHEAQRIRILFEVGIFGGTQVIQWADYEILNTDAPADELLSLSMAGRDNTAEIGSFLRRMSVAADFWEALQGAIPAIRDYLIAHPEKIQSIANQLYVSTNNFAFGEVPQQFAFIDSFDDAFSLARDGIWGDVDAVRKDFVRELDRLILEK